MVNYNQVWMEEYLKESLEKTLGMSLVWHNKEDDFDFVDINGEFAIECVSIYTEQQIDQRYTLIDRYTGEIIVSRILDKAKYI